MVDGLDRRWDRSGSVDCKRNPARVRSGYLRTSLHDLPDRQVRRAFTGIAAVGQDADLLFRGGNSSYALAHVRNGVGAGELRRPASILEEYRVRLAAKLQSRHDNPRERCCGYHSV